MTTTEFGMKDSGTRQQFDTGAVRDTQDGKGRYDLLPPDALRRVAVVFQKGGKKYKERNWERGINVTRFFDSALRHTFQALNGETDEDHAGQAAWNILCAIQTQEWAASGVLPASLDDVPKRGSAMSRGIRNLTNKAIAAFDQEAATFYSLKLATLPEGRTYTFDEIVDWLRSNSVVDAPVLGAPAPTPERIYVAGPYSDVSPDAIKANVTRAAKYANAIMWLGHDAHCPHTATHQVDELGNHRLGYERWMRLDMGILEKWATGIFVIATSPGVNREVERAKQLGLKVYYSLSALPDLTTK